MKVRNTMGRIFLVLSLIWVSFSTIWADGVYVSVTGSAAITADQRAILIKNGNQISMTLSTGYTGEGDDFGWIIPTPVPPVIEDVVEAGEDGEAAFEFLDQMTAPIEITYESSGCFPAGTAVLTADGLSPIEKLWPGTEVYACDLTSDRWVLAKVLRRQAFEWEGDMVTIEMGGHTIQTTGNQPVYVMSGNRLSSRPVPQEVSIEDQQAAGPGRWVEARDLEEGDVLKKKDGNALIITGLTSREQKQRVYCLEVEQFHNCAVHREGILVHNGGKKGIEAAAESSSEPLVTVYGRVTLEHYEVSVLGAADASALLDWLEVNDYQVSSESKVIFAGYIERDWAFVAVKLNPSERRHYENEFLPPLTMRYRHDELIFPLLISSISTVEQAKITLYVIAESAVASSNFRTAELVYDGSRLMSNEYVEGRIQDTVEGESKALVTLWSGPFCQNRQPWYYERFPDARYVLPSGFWQIDRLCRSPLPECAMYLTRLEARMRPADMTEDISFAAAPSQSHFEVIFD